MQALLLEIGADRYAVDLAAVVEVVPEVVVTPLPRGPRAAVGVFNLRGDVLALFDTALLLGVPGGDRGGHVAIVETRDGRAGLTSDGVARRTPLGPAAGDSEVPAGLGRRAVGDGDVATLLDVDGLLGLVGRR